ncbi:hypothetical protein H6G81_23885 [Scytonema hofmannii FACHB-248]|uniref:Class IIb bacteriocin, lactobin A/cerein 7B family n=1 Tax=Scytonema hofmannii FACHB-248 TaxID=1842502 RepID=A0ABR8GWF2_9CYAN|nr:MULTISPECIES: hypothetical protein [Nostocales]MBD2607482.1 hypothetical protein [Scytonema hofmannii FACHB-248]
MTTIRISNLNVSGLDLLSDEESYLNEINKEEFDWIHGGGSPVGVAVVAGIVGIFAGSVAVSKELKKFHDRRDGFTSFL